MGSRWGGRKAQRLTRLCLATYGTQCVLCDNPTPATTAHHVIPRSLGGPDQLWNLRPAHLKCNQDQGARMTDRPAESGLAFFMPAGSQPVALLPDSLPAPSQNGPHVGTRSP